MTPTKKLLSLSQFLSCFSLTKLLDGLLKPSFKIAMSGRAGIGWSGVVQGLPFG